MVVLYLRGRGRLLIALFAAVAALTLLQLGLIRGAVAVLEVTTRHRAPIVSVERDDRRVALTFDAIWGPGEIEELLLLLKDKGVKATFFVSGYFLDRYPDLARRISIEGHEIGSSGFSYAHLASLTLPEIRDEIARTHTLIKSVTGAEAKAFRPPFGEYSDPVIEAAEGLGYSSVLWSLDSLDSRNPPADLVYRRVSEALRPGAIVLLHVGGRTTLQAVGRLVDWMKTAQYEPVRLDQLLHKDNYYIDSQTGVQRLLPGTAPQPPTRRRRFWLTWPR